MSAADWGGPGVLTTSSSLRFALFLPLLRLGEMVVVVPGEMHPTGPAPPSSDFLPRAHTEAKVALILSLSGNWFLGVLRV